MKLARAALPAAFTLLFLAGGASAFERGQADLSAENASAVGYSSQDGLTYRFSGYDEEKGVFRLFLKAERATPDYENFTPEQLNAIEPAAGVQFHLKF